MASATSILEGGTGVPACASGGWNRAGRPVSNKTERSEPHCKEGAMVTRTRAPLLTLGWQTWSIVAAVLALVLLLAGFVAFGVGSN